MNKRNGKNYLKRNRKRQLKVETSLEEKQDGEKSSFLFNLLSFREENAIDRRCRISSFPNNNSLEVSFSKIRKASEDSAHLFQSPSCPDSCFSYENRENSKPVTKNVKFKNKNGKKNKNSTIRNIQGAGIKKNSKKNTKLNKNDNSIVNNYVEKCTIDWSEIENFDLIVEKNGKEADKIKLDLSDEESKLENINTKMKTNKSISLKIDKSLFRSWDNRNITNIEVTENDHCTQSTQGNTKDRLSFRSDSELNFSSLKEILSPTLGLGKAKPKYGLTTSTPNVTPVKFGHKMSNNYDSLLDNSLMKSSIQNFECSALESTKAKLEYLINKTQIHDNILMYKGEKLSNSVYKTQAIKGAHDKNFSVALENSNICETEPDLSNRKDVFLGSSHEISKKKAIRSISLASDYSKVLCNSLSLHESNVNNSEEKQNNKILSNEDIFYTSKSNSLRCTRVPISKVSTNGNFSKFVQYSRLPHQKYYLDSLSLLQKSYNIDGSFEEVKESSTCYFKSYCEFVSLVHNLSNYVDNETNTVSKFSKASSKDISLLIREDVLENNPSVIVLTLCNQVVPLKFLEIITPEKLQHMEKIGEGLYGEVFCCNLEEKHVFKIVPIEGNIVINGEHQKSFQEIMPEMLISLELSVLLQSTSNVSPNFIQVNRISCVFGMYPEKLLQCWDKYAENKGTENDRPDCFPSDQLFIIFEFAYGGIDLESIKLKNIVEAKSIFQQVACALAVAEEAIEFEHRDLHWGNILIAPTVQTTIDYVLRDDKFTMTTSGILVTIIDFTLSYLRKDGCTIFTNLAEDTSLFMGEGDYQFDIYRLMKENNGNKWDTFSPYSNVLWLHYLLEKLLKEKAYRNTKSHKSVRIQLQKWQKCILNYKSAMDFVTNSDFLKIIEKQKC